MGPCSMSKKSQSKPAAARIWAVATLGMDTIMPMPGLSAARRAFRGLMAGVEGLKAPACR